MIKRYSRKELTDIWSEENKYKIWLDVEVAAAEAMEKLGQIPRGVSSIVRKKAKINVKRIHQIESQVKHDVIAFLTSVTEKAGIKALYEWARVMGYKFEEYEFVPSEQERAPEREACTNGVDTT